MRSVRCSSPTVFTSLLVVFALLVGQESSAQGIICNPLTTAPSYSFDEVLDAADYELLDIRVNDRGQALLTVIPVGAAGRCLLRYTGASLETIVCEKAVDPSSKLVSFQDARWNLRGEIVVGGTLDQNPLVCGTPAQCLSHIQRIDTNGVVVGLPTFDNSIPVAKRTPLITNAGEVAYFHNNNGSLLRFDPTLPGNDKSALVVPSTTVAIEGIESAGGGDLYFDTFGNSVGRIQGAFGPTPTVTTVPITGSAFGVPTPNRFGAFLYLTTSGELWRQIGIGVESIIDATPVVELDSGTEPVNTNSGVMAGACDVALIGTAQGVCMGGVLDRQICDPAESPNPCIDSGGFCQSLVGGRFVWHAGSFAPLAIPGDPMLGSVLQDFFSGMPPWAFQGSNAGHIFVPVRLTDGRRVLVRANPVGSYGSPVLPLNLCNMGVCFFQIAPQGWTGVFSDGIPIHFERDVATGFDYAVDLGDPLFASVVIPEPLPNGDANFILHVGMLDFPLLAGEQFDLTQVDPLGVAAFSISGIDPDPNDPTPFVTGATFMEARGAVVTAIAVPESGALAGGLAALVTVLMLQRRRRTPGDQVKWMSSDLI